MNRLPSSLAYVVAGLAVLSVLLLPFALSVSDITATEALNDFYVHSFVLFAVLGAVIVWRRPGHGIGWLLVFIGAFNAVFGFSSEYRLFGFHEQPGFPSEELVYAVSGWTWVPATSGVVMALPLLFPDGRLPSRRWRPLALTAVLATVLLSVVDSLSATPVDLAYVEMAAYLLYGGAMLACLVPLVIRFRRSRDVERLQFKWVLIGLAISVPAVAVGTVWSTSGGGGVLTLFPLVVTPVAITVAVLRYRLYDIDVVINRALVYGSLTAILAGVYVGSVLLLQLILSGLIQGSGLAVAASTLAVAALFRPVRGRIQATVDRRFFRSRYDAARTIESFGARLRDEVDLGALSVDLQAAVVETMRPTHVSLWLRSPGVGR